MLKMITHFHSERLQAAWKAGPGVFSVTASETVKVKSDSRRSILLEVFSPKEALRSLRQPDTLPNKVPPVGETSAAVEATVCLADLYKSVKQYLQPVL